MTSPFLDPETGWPLILLGVFLLIGFLAHALGEKTHLPRVSLILLLGAIVGPHGMGLIPASIEQWFPLVSQLALCMVGFMLGEQFLSGKSNPLGKVIISIAVMETVFVTLIVFCLLLVVGAPPILALLLAAIGPSSAPAATSDVIRESGAKGVLSSTVLGVVAIDDAFGIILFTVLAAVAFALQGENFSIYQLMSGLWDIGGAVFIGVVIGWPMARLTGRIKKGEPLAVETLGFVLLCGGVAKYSGCSYLLASIVLGAMVANFARHHTRPFHAIRGVNQPFLIIFFLLAGFSFNIADFLPMGFIGVAYIIARTLGKYIGGYVGAKICGAPENILKYAGWCLLPQAGVALGLGLLAAEKFPLYGGQILSVLVGTTLVFEMLGPIVTRYSLSKAGELSTR